MVDNLMSVVAQYGSDDKCRACLVALKWHNWIASQRCQSSKISRISAREVCDCDSRRDQFSVTAGSIFHDSHLPLTNWFFATYVMVESRKGVSANQFKRMLASPTRRHGTSATESARRGMKPNRNKSVLATQLRSMKPMSVVVSATSEWATLAVRRWSSELLSVAEKSGSVLRNARSLLRTP
jgi:hypothetical protein